MIEDTYDSLVNTQEFSYRSSHQGPQLVPTDQAQATTRKLSSFTKTENLCFTAIYNGKYEAKEIAEYICRSHRTVEGLMSSMIAKLEVKNRYELFVEISKSHLHMRYLLNNSASQKERSQNHSQEKCSLV
jgi:DNA-binding NarL/FixJ family response regulator